MTPEERQAFIDDLRHTLIVAGMNMEAWSVLTNHESRALHTRTMNTYVSFFRTSINAHFVGMLIAFYRLFETRTDTFNIPMLLRKLREDGALPIPKLDELDALCASAHPIWVKINILRNKAFGHRNAELSTGEVFEQAAISENQFRDHFSKTKELLNTLTHALSNEQHAFNIASGESLSRMLEDLGRPRS